MDMNTIMDIGAVVGLCFIAIFLVSYYNEKNQ